MRGQIIKTISEFSFAWHTDYLADYIDFTCTIHLELHNKYIVEMI